MKKSKSSFICGMRGYSLIELVIAMSLMLIIAMVITSLLNISSKSLEKTYSYQDVNSEISYTIEYIKDEIAFSEYNYSTDGKVFFAWKDGEKYEYINYEYNSLELKRNLFEATKLKNFNHKNPKGSNKLIEKVDNFYLKDMGSYYELYIEKDNNKVRTNIAKRNLSL